METASEKLPVRLSVPLRDRSDVSWSRASPGTSVRMSVAFAWPARLAEALLTKGALEGVARAADETPSRGAAQREVSIHGGQPQLRVM